MSEEKDPEEQKAMQKAIECHHKGEHSRALSFMKTVVTLNPSAHLNQFYYSTMLQHCDLINEASHHLGLAISLLPIHGTEWNGEFRARYMRSQALLLKLRF